MFRPAQLALVLQLGKPHDHATGRPVDVFATIFTSQVLNDWNRERSPLRTVRAAVSTSQCVPHRRPPSLAIRRPFFPMANESAVMQVNAALVVAEDVSFLQSGFLFGHLGKSSKSDQALLPQNPQAAILCWNLFINRESQGSCSRR